MQVLFHYLQLLSKLWLKILKCSVRWGSIAVVVFGILVYEHLQCGKHRSICTNMQSMSIYDIILKHFSLGL